MNKYRMPKRFAQKGNGKAVIVKTALPENVIRKRRVQPEQPVLQQAPPVELEAPVRMASPYPWDLRVIGTLAKWVVMAARWYPKPKACLLAHSKGFVPHPAGYISRREICGHCRARVNKAGMRPLNGEPDYCGYRGGCGCGHYLLARLSTWKLRLKNWHCPARRF